MEEDKEKYCLNCGMLLRDEKYCPECGQTTSTGRLTTKTFLAEMFAGLTRLNRGFLYTCWRLLISPWRVISDYIHGRRKNYSGPVQTLIVLCFLAIFLDTVFGSGIVTDAKQELSKTYTDAGIDGMWRQFADWYAASPTVQYLIVFIPTIPAFMLVTRKAKRYRYNLAESFVAAIYTSSTMLMVSMLVSPLNHLLSPIISAEFITYLYILIMGSIGIYKAVRPLSDSKGKAVLRLLAFYGLSAFNYLIFLILFSIFLFLFFFSWKLKH